MDHAVETLSPLDAAIMGLRVARHLATRAQERLTEKRRQFDEANADLLAYVQEKKEYLHAEEGALRAVALAQYALTKQKQLAPGIGIRAMMTLSYDHQAALAWAVAHNIALISITLDVKAFEEMAKTLKLSFVETITTPQVTLGKTL